MNKMFKFKFNVDHYIRILGIREKLGKFCYTETEIKNHFLIGRKCICLDSNKEYIVNKVIKQWNLGYYITLILKDLNKNYRVIYWENICCHENTILDEININRKRVKFIK